MAEENKDQGNSKTFSGALEPIREHPIRFQWKAEWTFFYISREGGKEYIAPEETMLFRHRLENNLDYTNRQDRAYYPNFCGEIVDVYMDHLFRAFVRRDLDGASPAVKKLFGSFLKNVDRKGSHIEDFMKNDVTDNVLTYGHGVVLVDMPRIEEAEGMSRAEELENGIMPYFTFYTPMDTIDWETDPFGNLKWIMLREYEDDTEGWHETIIPQERRETPIYRVYDRNNWYILEEDQKTIRDQGEHGLGEVPVVPCYYRMKKPLLGKSMIADVSHLNRSIFNWCSLLDEIVYRQTFSQIVMQGDPQDENSNTKNIGTHQVIWVPLDARLAPRFISPDAAQAEVLEKRIVRGVGDIYRLARLEAITSNMRQFQQSGKTKTYDWWMTNNTLVSIAQQLATCERGCVRLWLLWQKIKKVRPLITYPEKFDIVDMLTDLQNLTLSVAATMPPTANKIQRRNILEKIIREKNPEEEEAIKEELKIIHEKELEAIIKGEQPASGTQVRNGEGEFLSDSPETELKRAQRE